MWQSQVESANHLLKSSLEMGRNCTHTINTTTRNNIKMMTMIDSYIHGWAQAGLAQKVSTRWLRLLCTWCGLWPLGQPSSNGSRRVCRTKDETKCFINEACTGWDRKLVDYLIVGTLLCGQPAKWCHTSLSTFDCFLVLPTPWQTGEDSNQSIEIPSCDKLGLMHRSTWICIVTQWHSLLMFVESKLIKTVVLP